MRGLIFGSVDAVGGLGRVALVDEEGSLAADTHALHVDAEAVEVFITRLGLHFVQLPAKLECRDRHARILELLPKQIFLD